MDAATLVQALAVAWNGFQLYPDPKAVASFMTAVETIGEYAGSPYILTIGVEGFESAGEVVPAQNNAAGRLAQALFAERVENLAIAVAPDAEEVIQFCSLLDQGPDQLDADLDLPTRLQLAGVSAIRVRCHEILKDREEEEADPVNEHAADREPDIQALFEDNAVITLAKRFAHAGSEGAAAEDFVAVYRATYAQVKPGDTKGLQRVVQTFVDAFFRLDHDYRSSIFEAILAVRDEEPFRNFLDQLSAGELLDLSRTVADSALPLLIEYARVVSEMQGHDSGLVEQLVEEGADSRQVVAGSVGLHLARFLNTAAPDEGEARVVEDVRQLPGAPRAGWSVLTDLFALERRPERVGRLLRIWVSKVVASVRARDFASAVRWVDVLESAEVDAQLLNAAYTEAASDEVLAVLSGEGEDDEADVRRELFATLSRRAGGRVIEQLAVEQDPGRRRMLIDLVTEIARIDIRSVLPGLSDPRWFVVRNVAIALGKSARKAAGDPLVKVVGHEDHRVRIEALRALIPCLGVGALDHLVEALADEHVRVRAAASDLLGTLDDEVVVPALSSALGNETLPVEVRIAVIDALRSHRTESARGALRSIAESKARFSPSARTLRSAARDALRSTNG